MKQLCSSPAAERVGIGETSSEAVHVAVGRSLEKTLRLLEWTFRRFSCREIVLVHIHQPSSTIPTLLGKLPADQANEELVSAHRLEEWKNTQKLLLRYLNICYNSKVQPKVILIEAEHISKGIVYVVNKHAIRKLVMGASPNKCFKVKGRFSKAIYVAKNAPFCEICFVHKGKLVLMREAIDSSETVPSETIPTNSSEASRLPEANKFREELEELIAATKLKQNVLVNQKEEIAKELRSTMKNVAILDGRLHESIHRQDEATIQIDSIMSSIAKLELENKKIQHQRDEYVQQIERLRCNHHRKSKLCNKFIGLGSNSLDFKEFSLSDLQTATFGFSDTLMIEQGGNGCVYKGEMLSRSVAIKKFHHHSVQGQREFQQEVFVLSKLRHPNLVTLIGACPEASSLVYEYLPNGNLHDRIIRKNMSPSLAWTTRVRIIHEISCALLFLHSSKPEKIVHGDLKPTNIFLDSNLSCRISGFGFCELLSDRVAAGPSHLLRQSSVPKNFCGEFPYADPEYQRSGVLTSKSDVYSLGVMVLQLLTGRTPIGLATEVRRAVLSHRLSDLLDSSAGEWPMNVAQKLAGFGLKCAEPCGHDRPELTPAVVRELKLLHSNQERPAPTSFLCPILKEIMYEPVVAADGFTYEEIAIREWFDNGRETSPMTNLGLENLNLFPNNALKFAIQDWLC